MIEPLVEVLRVLLIGLGFAGLVGCAGFLILSASATDEGQNDQEGQQRRRR